MDVKVLENKFVCFSTFDTTPPVITKVVPVEGSRINGEIRISALASDNVSVAEVEFYYSVDLDGTMNWVSIGKLTQLTGIHAQ